MSSSTIPVLVMLSVAACGANRGDGSLPDAATNVGDCAQGADLVYVIDQQNNLLSQFDPGTQTFTDLGSLSCPNLGAVVTMSVERDAIAWVGDNAGQVFRVDINHGLACTATSYPGATVAVAGMGYSTDQAGGSTETLYASLVPPNAENFASTKLAKVDFTSSDPLAVNIDAAPSLGGTPGYSPSSPARATPSCGRSIPTRATRAWCSSTRPRRWRSSRTPSRGCRVPR